MKQVIIAYKGHIIRELPTGGALIATPAEAECIYVPRQRGISIKESIKQVEKLIDRKEVKNE